MDFIKPIKLARQMSQHITIPRLAPIVRASGYCYNVLIVSCVIDALILGMAKIVVGAINITKCSLQPLLPVYLIVDSLFILLIPWTIENKDKRISLRMQLVLALILIIGLVFGTIWVTDVSQELNGVGHCGAMSAPTAASLPTTPDANATSVAKEESCATCSAVLVRFTAAVVAIQWLITVLAMFNGAMVVIKRCFSEEPASDCCQSMDDKESTEPINNAAHHCHVVIPNI